MLRPHLIVQELRLHERKACLFDRAGYLHWRSPAWDGACNHAAVLGHRWREFVEPDDLPHLDRYFAGGGDDTIQFRCVCSGTGSYLLCSWHRLEHCGLWVIIGNAEVLPDPPAPPCLA